MKFCQHCGKEILDEAVVCTGCGCSVQYTGNKMPIEVDDTVSVGLVILSVLLPVFGVIYWPIMAKSRPKNAKTCGIAALISWGISLLVNIFLAPVYMALIGSIF